MMMNNDKYNDFKTPGLYENELKETVPQNTAT